MEENANVPKNPETKEKAKKPVYKKWWFWVIIVIVAIIIIGSINGGNNTASNGSATTSAALTTTSAKKTEYNVGETFSNSYVNVTFVACNDNFTAYEQYAEVKSGYKIVQAEFDFENVGKSDFTDMYTDFNCYADGVSCDAFYSVEDSGFSDTLSAGKKAVGRHVYFQVPENANSITIEYSTSYWTSEKVVFVVK